MVAILAYPFLFIKILTKVMKKLKTPIPHQFSQQSTLSIKLNIPSITGQSLKRVTLEDANKFKAKYYNHTLLEKLKLLFQDAEKEEKSQQEAQTFFDIFHKYISLSCQSKTCPYKASLSPICANCLMQTNHIRFSISDNSITYHIFTPSQFTFNSSNDVENISAFLSYFSNLCKINTQTYIPFQAVPPNSEELKAIFFFHREWVRLSLKSPEIKGLINIITYSFPLHFIHYQIAERLSLLYHAPDAITSCNNISEQITHFQHARSSIILKKFQINASDVDSLRTALINRTNNFNSLLFNNTKIIKPFENLTRTFLALSCNNTTTLDQLAIMFAKIFMGRPYLNYLDKNANHLTLVITKNINFVSNFLMDVFKYMPNINTESPMKIYNSRNEHYFCKNNSSFYHVTKYSAASLSDENNIGEFIKDKIGGNIVNIDTTTTSASPNFKNIIDGKAVTHKDPYFGELRYRSNAHYIRINQDISQSRLENYNIAYDTILCNGNLSNAIYEPLDDYELFFLVTGFVNYGIDLLTKIECEPEPSKLTPLELVNEFIDNFCIDTTNTISINSETFEIKSETKRTSIAKELGIMQLPFTHIDTLAEYFTKWCNITHKDILYDEKVIKNTFIDKFPNIFYFKKKATTPSGKEKDARGIYGLKFEQHRFITYCNTIDSSIDSENSVEIFISYFEKILNDYYITSIK